MGWTTPPLRTLSVRPGSRRLHDFIQGLPDGYDTWVGERGITISGGQRQRLAIAPTILRDPPILVLDDSTSSVDVGTESLIQRALAEAAEERTTFIIAHRLSTVRNADLILVLDRGRVVECGSHEELLAGDGYYRRIYDLQLRPQEETHLFGAELSPADLNGAGAVSSANVVLTFPFYPSAMLRISDEAEEHIRVGGRFIQEVRRQR